jgi:GAF domain-containing protein/HAMP domain-containing protein
MRLGISFMALAVFVLIISLSSLYFTARAQLRADVRQRLLDIVSIAAPQIDATGHNQLTDPAQEGGPTYRQIQQTLQRIRDVSSDLYYVYTMRLNDAGEIEFVVDAEAENPEEIAHLGEIYDDASPLLKRNIATLEQPIVEEEFYTDEWGTWITGYAPFFDADGDRAGVLGVDIRVDRVRAYENQLLRRSLVITGVTLPVVALFGWLLGRYLTAPIVRLRDRVQAIAGGNWEQKIAVHSQDELGELAIAFNQMAARIQHLVGSLERRVEARTEDLARRTRYLEATAEVARDVAAQQDVQTLLSSVVRLISDRFGFYHAGIFLRDSSGEWMVLQAASSRGGQRMLSRGHRLRVGEEGIVGYVTAHGEPRVALDVGDDAVFFDNPDLPETHSEIALPLRVRGVIIGALDVQSKVPEAFRDEDVEVLQTLADQVAVAISNARLFEETQKRLETERRAYGELTREAWAQMLRSQPIQGFLSHAEATIPAGDLERPEMKMALRTGEIMPDPEKKRLAIPIKVRDQVIGVVDGRKPDGGGAWTAEEIEVLQTLTDQLSLALESARLYADTQRRAAREQIVGEVTSRMRETLQMETVLNTAVREIGEALGLAALDVRLDTNEQ